MKSRFFENHPMNLQFFAEETKEEPTKDPETKPETKTEEKAKTFTQEELDRIIQDRLAKTEKQWKAKLESEKSQAEKLASMSAEERAKAEFEQERAEFLKEKKKFERQSLELQTRVELANSGLAESFAPFILNATAETVTAEEVKTLITEFKKIYEADLTKKVEERLKKPTPNGGSMAGKTLDITKMTPEEINANWETLSKKK